MLVSSLLAFTLVKIAYGSVLRLRDSDGVSLPRDISHPENRMASRASAYQRPEGPVPTPFVNVYFHIIHDGEAGNVTDEAVYAQADVLNREFSRNDMGIIWNVIGLDRIQNAEWFAIVMDPLDEEERLMKTALRQGDAKMLNVYITHSHYGGFAYFPPMVKANIILDGIVLPYENLPGGTIEERDPSLTLVSMAGVWMGVRPTYEGNCNYAFGDDVEDTPTQAYATRGLPGSPLDKSPGQLGIASTRNLMDTVDDECRIKFTPEQKVLANEEMEYYRGIRLGFD